MIKYEFSQRCKQTEFGFRDCVSGVMGGGVSKARESAKKQVHCLSTYFIRQFERLHTANLKPRNHLNLIAIAFSGSPGEGFFGEWFLGEGKRDMQVHDNSMTYPFYSPLPILIGSSECWDGIRRRLLGFPRKMV